jgi:hypothetical protein
MTSRRVTPKPYTSCFFDNVPLVIYSGGMYPLYGEIGLVYSHIKEEKKRLHTCHG